MKKKKIKEPVSPLIGRVRAKGLSARPRMSDFAGGSPYCISYITCL